MSIFFYHTQVFFDLPFASILQSASVGAKVKELEDKNKSLQSQVDDYKSRLSSEVSSFLNHLHM